MHRSQHFRILLGFKSDTIFTLIFSFPCYSFTALACFSFFFLMGIAVDLIMKLNVFVNIYMQNNEISVKVVQYR